jgi:hypothetical protein
MHSEELVDKWIRVIALFKLVKAALVAVVGVGVLKLLHRDVGKSKPPGSRRRLL